MIYYSLIIILIYFFIKYKVKNNTYFEKINILEKNINKINKEKKELKFKSYYNIFRIIRHIYINFKPETISLYYYGNKNELKTKIIKFLYQIKTNDKETKMIFTGKNNNIPITNINIITNLYFYNKFFIVNNINKLSKYDKGLYEKLKKNDINSIYLINIYSKDIYSKNQTDINIEKNYINKPIGLISLTYKNEEILSNSKIDILNKEISKISEHLLNVLSF